MRTNAWSDCFGLRVLYGWLIAGLLAVGFFVVSECTPREAHAGSFYLDFAGGLSIGTPCTTLPDGDWYQKGLPYQCDTTSIAWRAGLGYRFNERWSIQASYLKPGDDHLKAKYVSDADYDPISHTCLTNCGNALTLVAKDKKQIVELSVARTWAYRDVQPFLRIGGGAMLHEFSIYGTQSGFYQEHSGTVPLGLIGAGLCYGIVCAEATYYQQIGPPLIVEYGYPMATNAVVSTMGVKIPIGG